MCGELQILLAMFICDDTPFTGTVLLIPVEESYIIKLLVLIGHTIYTFFLPFAVKDGIYVNEFPCPHGFSSEVCNPSKLL